MAADARPQGGQLASGEHDQLTRLGKYVIEKRLGAGGMGTVFLAVDSELKRTVALKVLPKDRAENPVLVKRFKAEGQAAAYLQHKNIVGVYEAGQIGGFLYIALEYIDGTDVLDIIRKRGVIPVKRSLEITQQIAGALDHAYEKQIVHRDIKPSNLLIKRDGTVKLADLGLARSIDDTLDTSITRAGTTVGTVDYMSPEQARNSKAADIRSDIYSLGCTWYHMLTGVPPFGEGSMTNKLQAHAISPPPDPRLRNEKVPEGVVAVLQRMMAKKPQDRYQTPAELLEDLQNPGLIRTGLNADVLAALADEGDEVSDGSTSSVEVDSAAFELPPQDRDGSSEKSGKPRPSTEPDTRDSMVTSIENVSKPKPGKKGAVLPPRSPGAKVERQAPEEPDDSWKSAPYKKKDRSQSVEEVRAKLPPRSSVTTAASSNTAESTPRAAAGKARKPPRRGDEAILSGTAKASIDPIVLKYGIVGVLVVAILGGLWYAFATSSETGLTGGANPYQGTVQPSGSQGPEPSEQQGDEGQAEEHGAVKVTEKPTPPAADPAAEARKAAAAIAGAEDLDLNGASGRQFVPDWVITARKPAATTPAAVVVERGARDNAKVRSLADALARLPAGEAVIEFSGDGPFAVSQVELPNRTQLTFRAAENSRPVLVLAADDVKAGEAVLRFMGGRLVLDGVHLVLATRSNTAEGIAMVAAPVSVIRDCTFTQGGPSVKAVTAIDVLNAGNSAEAGCVLENCVIRGISLSAVRLSGARSNVLAGNTLMASGLAPCVDVAPAAAQGAAAPARRISMLGVTAISGSGVFRLRHGLTDPAAPCEIACRRTLFLADPNGESTWLTAAPWPATPANDLESPLAAGVKWISDRTAFAGWKRLIKFESGSGAHQEAVDDAGWKQFWRQGAASIDSRPEPVVLAEEQRRLDPAMVAAALQTAGLPGWGCDATKLTKAPQGLLDRALAFAERRRLPADFIADRELPQVVSFDLNKGASLPAFLNDASKCPDGAVVELRGSGIKQIPPIKLQNKSLRLKFVQGDEASLRVRPLISGSGEAVDAWITVEGGSIDLIGARLELPASDRQPYPRCLLKVTGGSFSIRQCSIVGPADRSQKANPLIVWSPGGQGAGLIEDSLLIGRVAIVEADLADRLLEVRNSVLASFDDVFRLTSGTDASGLGTLAIQDTTIANGGAAYRITSAEGQAAHLAVFLSHSVYIPTFNGPGQSPTVLATSSGDASRGIAWWEDGIGYGPQLQQVLVQDSLPSVKLSDMPAAWESLWKEGHVLRPLTEQLGVALEKLPADPEKILPAGFTLSPTCAAANWNASGGPIGARLDDVGVSEQPATGSAAQTTPNPAKTPKPRSPKIKRPDF